MGGVVAGADSWLARIAAVVLGAVAAGCVAVAAATAASWSVTHQLVSPRVRTFSPELAVNGHGLAVTAWFAGPGPPVAAGGETVAAPARWTGNKIVVSLGSIAHGLGKPLLVARNGTDVQGQIKVAMSGSGIAYVAWLRADHTGSMIATSHAGKMAKPRRLELPRGSRLQRLAHGLAGPVDAFSYRANGHGFTFYCTRLRSDGTSARTIVARQPYKANPCHLPATTGMNGSKPAHSGQPPGFQLPPETVKSKSDGHGDALAVWDDWPTTGPAWTYGLFYAIRVR